MIAAVCGDCVLWRPSSETTLCAIAVQKIVNRVFLPPWADRRLQSGDRSRAIRSARLLIRDHAFRWSASTGSTQVGRHVSEAVAAGSDADPGIGAVITGSS